jgi:hypothetical protein
MADVVIQATSLVGSFLILAAFIAVQLRRMRSTDLAYVVLNLIGSAILAGVAVVEQQWGFLLLEGIWALVSLGSLVHRVRGRPPDATD